MTTSWTKLTTHDEAMRRAGGRNHYNSVRKLKALLRLVEIRRLVDEYGMGHGVRQRIADELGVHRSTISRQLRPYCRARVQPSGPHPTHPPRNGYARLSRWVRGWPRVAIVRTMGMSCDTILAMS